MLHAATSQYGVGNEDELVALLQAVATCALQDIADLQSGHKGKAKEGLPRSDGQLALELFAEEANDLLQSTRDLEIALGLEKAMRMDAPVLEQLRTMEDRASQDREVALALSQGRAPPPRPPTPLSPESSGSFADLSSEPDESDGDNEVSAGASSSKVVLPSTRKTTSAVFPMLKNITFAISPKKLEPQDCVICSERIRGEEIRVPCGHYYDRACLIALYEALTRDEELFPPRCCQQEFDFSVIRRYLPIQLASLFLEKAREYRTADRVYCHRNTCSTFLGAKTDHVTNIRCPRCMIHTCGQCKAATHPGQPCSAQSDEAVLALAEEAGWKRCPNCRHLVELAHGCFHMTCRCRYQFCYLCTARWKTCTCRQWDENRLLYQAQDQVQRRMRVEPGPARGAPNVLANYNVMVQREVERLRVDHDCQHTAWQYRPGRGRCEHCNFELPIFLLRCRGCNTLACVRCRRNRL